MVVEVLRGVVVAGAVVVVRVLGAVPVVLPDVPVVLPPPVA